MKLPEAMTIARRWRDQSRPSGLVMEDALYALLDEVERLHQQQWDIAEAIFTNDAGRAAHWAAGIKVMIQNLDQVELRPPDAWTAVSVRLPAPDAEVLIYFAETGDYDIAQHTGERWVSETVALAPALAVTHWKPLEPPR